MNIISILINKVLLEDSSFSRERLSGISHACLMHASTDVCINCSLDRDPQSNIIQTCMPAQWSTMLWNTFLILQSISKTALTYLDLFLLEWHCKSFQKHVPQRNSVDSFKNLIYKACVKALTCVKKLRISGGTEEKALSEPASSDI